jgi:nicotinate phosphoribosyltransferase
MEQRNKPLGLYTDLYQLRMVESYIQQGMNAPATFSLFIRPTPERPWFVAYGIQRAIEVLDSFTYHAEAVGYLRSLGFDMRMTNWLSAFRPQGELCAVPDGTIVLADEPILELTAPLPVAQLYETSIINVIQLGTLVATKAARVSLAAQGRPCVDFGFRRAQGLETGVQAALAANVGGGMATSNVEAGRRFGIPCVGTMSHSYVQAFTEEVDAFRAFARDHPDRSVLLVDTYDTLEGVRKAIVVADEMKDRGERLRGVRLDSGDLATLSREARQILDEAGHTNVEIFASGGLDELRIAELVAAGAPIDAFGVGTDLVTSSDRPAVDIVYKLVDYDGRPVRKTSVGKRTLPGRKQIFRSGGPESDVLGLRDEALVGTPLLQDAWIDGHCIGGSDIAAARVRVEEGLSRLPEDWRLLEPWGENPGPRMSAALESLGSDG